MGLPPGSLTAGERAPDVALRDQHGATVTLSAYRGERAVVLFFYPFAFSPVCTGEMHGLQEALPAFRAAGAEVLAVSCDPVWSLRAFAEAGRLDLPLLSDFWPHGAVARRYGVLDESSGSARRSSFLVDRTGLVRWVVHSAPGRARDLDEHLRALAGLDHPVER